MTNFWGNEIICDLIAICFALITTGHALASLMLLTRYRALTHNRVLRLIQDRFVFVGWDLFVVMEALGVDPLTRRSSATAERSPAARLPRCSSNCICLTPADSSRSLETASSSLRVLQWGR